MVVRLLRNQIKVGCYRPGAGHFGRSGTPPARQHGLLGTAWRDGTLDLQRRHATQQLTTAMCKAFANEYGPTPGRTHDDVIAPESILTVQAGPLKAFFMARGPTQLPRLSITGATSSRSVVPPRWRCQLSYLPRSLPRARVASGFSCEISLR